MGDDAFANIVIGQPHRNCERVASASSACAANADSVMNGPIRSPSARRVSDRWKAEVSADAYG